MAEIPTDPQTPVERSYALPGTFFKDAKTQVDDFAYRADLRRRKTVKFIDNVTFDATTTTATSESFKCEPYKQFIVLIELDVTGAPTDILYDIEYSDDGGKFYKLMNGPFGDLRYEDAGGDLIEAVTGYVIAPYMRIKATATGTGQGATFRTTVKVHFVG